MIIKLNPVKDYQVIFDPKAKDFIEKMAKRVTSIAEVSKTEGNRKNAALLINLEKEEVIEVSGDRTKNQATSFRHAIMILMKKFGKTDWIK